MQTPKEWPVVVVEAYIPIRTLGIGSFGSVVLAKRKVPHTENKENNLVAIKIVGNHRDGLTKSEIGYARRETEILKQIQHPNILKMIDYWEPDYGKQQTAAMALGYTRGPTIESLLLHGGALSSTFGRVVMAQMVDAISALHARAVIHRDIKPDNIIVTGATSKQDEVWDEPSEDEEGGNNNKMSWDDLRKKWHVTVIDFGFAKALSPDDVISPSRALQRENLFASYHGEAPSPPSVGVGRKKNSTLDISNGTRSTKDAEEEYAMPSLDKSLSRQFSRRMSALGTKLFCAPEIFHGMEDDEETMQEIPAKLTKKGFENIDVDITKNLIPCVSEYGLLVDAYSLGKTFRYMMTGVQPSEKAHYSSFYATTNKKTAGRRIKSWIKKTLGANKKKAQNTRKKKHFRLRDVVDSEAVQLIQDLTEIHEDKRLSVRAARRRKWIAEVLPESTNTANIPAIDFLDFVMNDKSTRSRVYELPPPMSEVTDCLSDG